MPFVSAPPCIERAGVIAGFVLSRNAYYEFLEMRLPNLSKGVLFAQGVMYRPTETPTPPWAPASQQSWLYYNPETGFYWADTPQQTEGDAFIGWVVTSATKILAISNQQIEVAEAQDGGSGRTVISLGPVQQQGPGDSILVMINGVPVTY